MNTYQKVKFSAKTDLRLEPNGLAALRDDLAGRRVPVLDLSCSNPTACAFRYPAEAILGALAGDGIFKYDPDPMGGWRGREAVCAHLARSGRTVSPSQVVLLSSTSEAYSLLFKLLADPGDTILCPVPSYPLFEHLARFESLGIVPYRLDPDQGWRPDLPSLVEARRPDSRVLITVNPNNPTGSFLDRTSLDLLARFAAEGGLGLISDEVFFEYPVEEESGHVSALDQEEVLTFCLGGLSKLAGLPQFKVGWIVVGGARTEVREALGRLELLCDAYLSVNTLSLTALPTILEHAPGIAREIGERIRGNLEVLRLRVRGTPLDVLRVPGGWTAILRVPRIADDEDLAMDLLTREKVLVHPGYFYDFDREGLLVLSLLVPPEVLQEGLCRILRYFGSHP